MEGTTPRVDPDGSYGLQLTMHIHHSKCMTLMQAVNNRGNFGVGRGSGELSVLFAQFFGKPKTTLKNGPRLGVVLCLDRLKSGVGLERTMYPRHTHPLPSKLPFF